MAHIKAEVSRFILIGGLNTLIGLSVSYIFVYIGLNNYLSNAIGYSIGLFVSFILNKYYVFRHNESNKVLLTQIVQFMIIFFIAYGFNLIILYTFLHFTTSYFSQLFAMIGYTVVFFLLNKFITFKDLK